MAVLLFSLVVINTGCSDKYRQPVDKTITQNIDVTGDGNKETVTLHILGDNFDSPFKWTLTIKNINTIILSYSADDSNLDKFFNDKGFYDGNSYRESKEKWYFNDILKYIVLPKSAYSVEGMINKSRDGTLYKLGTEFLSARGITGSKAITILNNIANKLKSGNAIVIVIPETPQQFSSPMVYSPEINEFIQIYAD